ncbi:MAG: ABC transporter ATP-binding protein [Pseudobdellovibrionaceae bacterium]
MLQVKNLHVYYGGIHALKGIDFQINQGEIVSLIGCNGAGKTTTLRALSGLVQAKGEVHFAEQGSSPSINPNKNFLSYPSYERILKGISQSPEGRGVFPAMSVMENLEMGCYTRRDKAGIQDDYEKCFQLFPKLKERQKQLAGTLSGGEQQMLAICRALMSRPKLLLLDDPSLGLAPLIVAQIFEIIQNLNREGMTILLVEQNARMALKISHRAYVLETGKIGMTGKGIDLLHNEEVKKLYLGH